MNTDTVIVNLEFYYVFKSTLFFTMTYRLEGVWDPVIVPGAPKQISYYFLNAVRELLLSY